MSRQNLATENSATRGSVNQKALKFIMNLNNSKEPGSEFEGRPSDIVIPVMGLTGVGKSTFINSVLGTNQQVTEVGHSLNSCTSQMVPVVIPLGSGNSQFTNPYNDENGRLVLVDTPGFEDSEVDNMEILRRISVWLALSYAKFNMKLGGVIYLHDITQNHMSSMTRKNLQTFQKLVGEHALKCVVLGTTKWQSVGNVVGTQRQEQLKSLYWKEIIAEGSQVISVLDENTPRAIVNEILNRIKSQQSMIEFLQIQRELVQMRKFVPQTEAGQTLRYSLDELIRLQKQRLEYLNEEDLQMGQQELRRLLKEFKVPLGIRIKRFFNL